MNRRQILVFALATGFAPLLAGCPLVPDVGFNITVDHDIEIVGMGTTVNSMSEVDLFEKSADLKKYSKNIESVEIKGLSASIVVIGEGNKATKLTGKLLVGGVEVAAIAGVGVAVDSSTTGTPSDELNAAIKAAVKGTGKLPVVITGTSDLEPLRISIRVNLQGRSTASPL